MTNPQDIDLTAGGKLRLPEAYAWAPPLTSYKNKPIEYIDPKPKPFVTQIALVEYFERVKRHKADRWQVDFCNRLQKAAELRHEKVTKAIVHAEAQLGKSSILAQTYAAWLLGHDPMHRVALATYNVSRSQAHSKSVIGIMNLPIHKEIFRDEGGWVSEKVSKEKWQTNQRSEKTTDAQDSFNPVGLQSGLTGSGFDTLVIDDPYADQKEAFSETVRLSLMNFWDFTVMSRIGDHANVFGMFHRYHVEDLAGYLLDTGKFDYWRYATVCDGDYIHDETGQKFSDPLGREVGEYISERRAPEYYDDNREDNRVWLSMFQGRPSSESGDFFTVNKIQKLTASETIDRKAECSLLVRAWDHASTEDGGDYSVGLLFGMTPDQRITVFDIARRQVDSAGRDAMQLRAAQEDGTDVLITIPRDPGAAGDTVVLHVQQKLQQYQVVDRPTSGSKEDRARNLAGAVNSGSLSFAPDDHLPEKLRWHREALKEMRNFPLSDHDDIVDAMADAYNECFERVTKGLVVKSFIPQQHLVTWDKFTALYGSQIPDDWTVYVGVKITADALTANSAVIVASAAETANIANTLFVIAEYKEYTDNYERLFDWLAETIGLTCGVRNVPTIILHKDSVAFKVAIQQKLNYRVRTFAHDAVTGLAEMNWYFKATDNEHPFNPGAKSCYIYGLIDSEQLSIARDSAGLVHLRQEAVTWGFDKKRQPNAVGGVLDCLRMLTYRFRTVMLPLTLDQKVELAIPSEVKQAMEGATTGSERWTAAMDYDFQKEAARDLVDPERQDEWGEWE